MAAWYMPIGLRPLAKPLPTGDNTCMSEPISRYQGRFLTMYDHDGWEYVSRSRGQNVVGIVAVTSEEQLVLVEQFRPPVNKRVLELPAGLVGDDDAGEASLNAARRELLEETGYASDRWCHFGTGLSSSGLSNESLDILVALDARREGPGGGVDGERIDTILVPVDRLHEMVLRRNRSGELLDLKILLAGEAIDFARRELNKQAPRDDQSSSCSDESPT